MWKKNRDKPCRLLFTLSSSQKLRTVFLKEEAGLSLNEEAKVEIVELRI